MRDLGNTPFTESISVESNDSGELFTLTVRVDSIESGRTGIPAIIANCGCSLVSFKTKEPDLEDIFINLVERKTGSIAGDSEI